MQDTHTNTCTYVTFHQEYMVAPAPRLFVHISHLFCLFYEIASIIQASNKITTQLHRPKNHNMRFFAPIVAVIVASLSTAAAKEPKLFKNCGLAEFHSGAEEDLVSDGSCRNTPAIKKITVSWGCACFYYQ